MFWYIKLTIQRKKKVESIEELAYLVHVMNYIVSF